QRLPVHLVAQQIVRAHRIGDRHAASERRRQIHVSDLLLTDVVGVEDNLLAPIQNARFLEQRRERRAGPPGVADATPEERQPGISRAFQREGDLLAWTGLQLIDGQAEWLVDQPCDLESPAL